MPPATPADDLRGWAARAPAGRALEWNGGSATWRELDARVDAVAAQLGAVAGGRAATIQATPGVETIVALFGVWRAGGIAVPLHERLTPHEVEAARRLVDPVLHLDDDALQRVARAAPPAHGYARGPAVPQPDHPATSTRSSCLAEFEPKAPPPPPEATLACILTSGSMGSPRAIGLAYHNLAASTAAVVSRLSLSAADRWGLCLSVGHVGGLALVARACLTGASVRLWPAFDPAAVAAAILSGDVTHLAIVPVMLRRLLPRLQSAPIPPTLRCILVGGAAAAPDLLDAAFETGLPLATTWGMTETTSQIATAPPALARQYPGSAGRPLRGIELRTGPHGVLQMRGPTLAASVVSRPGMQPQPLPTDSRGWFATRDLGRIDERGLVWIEGRADATIVSGGLNVSPAEVERVIAEVPGVREAVVFGVPDAEWGEAVAAVIEADPGSVSAATVDRHCRNRLSPGRRPIRMVVVNALERTWTGKVIRPRARDLLRSRSSPPGVAS